jgi:hypothetical protein
MLMNIYICTEGISDNLTDSFLHQDCSTFCYTGVHLKYVIASTIVIFVYLPIAIFCRPLWEIKQTFLNVKTKPIYLSILSIFQVVFVILNKTLKIYDQTIHGIVLILLLILLLVITIIMNPYNYRRATISQYTSLILSIWAILTSTIFRNYSIIVAWAIVEFTGILLLLIIGMIFMKKSTPLLYSEKGIKISTLFLFQFLKKYEKILTESNNCNFTVKKYEEVD